MDQNRLYYATPYVKTFMCTVISCTKNKKGTWDTILNQTAFYPEGGGQLSEYFCAGTQSVFPEYSRRLRPRAGD